MNTFLELAKNRYSCRSYQHKSIPPEVLTRVLEAVRVAPSAVNYQPYYFVVVSSETLRQKIATCYPRPWIGTAPVIIVACGDHSHSWRRADGKDHCDIDVAIAIDHLTLAATDNGLATCWVCKFDAMLCASLLELPAHVSPVALIPIGYPADEVNPNRHNEKRKELADLVRWNGFKP